VHVHTALLLLLAASLSTSASTALHLQETPEDLVTVRLADEVILDLRHMRSAQVQAHERMASDHCMVVVVLTEDGRRRLQETTAANAGSHLSILIDGEVVYEPVVLEGLDLKRIPIVEYLTLVEADNLAQRINGAIGTAKDGSG